jgi:hypothetical protein
MKRRTALASAASFLAAPAGVARETTATAKDGCAWLQTTLKELYSVEVGQTRRDLFRVFEAEGGLYTREWGHFVYRGCPFIKVDVKFRLADPEAAPRVAESLSMMGNPDDVITERSKPYLAWTIAD